MVLYLALNAAINAVGHTFGRQPFENGARNNQWLALLTAGEGLHNNHHAAPTSAKLGLSRGEIDPAWWFIRMARAPGLVTIRHNETHLKSERIAA
jgi:stearoyl-CoA desaturase (delta-9 desaturase)